jgi:hypothetical protein
MTTNKDNPDHSQNNWIRVSALNEKCRLKEFSLGIDRHNNEESSLVTRAANR